MTADQWTDAFARELGLSPPKLADLNEIAVWLADPERGTLG